MIIPDKLARGQSMARMADGTSKTAILCEVAEKTGHAPAGSEEPDHRAEQSQVQHNAEA